MKTFNVVPPVAKNDIPNVLRGAGISLTPQRLEIASILLSKIQHLSADQIRKTLKGNNMTVSRATVYNTLGLFVARGIVRELIVDGECSFYDSNTRPHHHFYDTDKSELIDFPSEDTQIKNLPELPPGTELDSVDLVVRLRRIERN
jgi:Fur family iron response transcriptional regulator